MQRLVFGRRDEAVKEALADYAHDILRMRLCLREAGYEISDEDLAAGWLYYSEGFAATWLTLPDDDRELLADLLEGKAPPLVIATPTGAKD